MDEDNGNVDIDSENADDETFSFVSHNSTLVVTFLTVYVITGNFCDTLIFQNSEIKVLRQNVSRKFAAGEITRRFT